MSAYLEEVFGLRGRTAMVTGGSSGIGRAMAVTLGRAGARVVLVARTSTTLAETVDELTAHGVEAAAVSVDLADRAALTAATDTIISRYGAPDVAGRGPVAERRLLQRGRARGSAHPTHRAGVRRSVEGRCPRSSHDDRPERRTK